MMKYSYLLFNFVVVLSSLVGVVLYKGGKFPQFKKSLFAISIPAVLFIAWDIIVTEFWWSFNPERIVGIFVATIPIEEALFFFCIPWSCLVIWENLQERIKGEISVPIERIVITANIILLSYSLFNSFWYTFSVSLGLVVFSLVSLLRGKWFQKNVVVVFIGIVSVLTIIFNNVLTTYIVSYNEHVLTGIRLGTMPIEDIGYGLLLLSSVVGIYQYLRL